MCGITQWIYTAEFCTRRTRIGVFQLTLDDVNLLEQEYIERSDQVIERFERAYTHLRADMPFLFIDHEFYDVFFKRYFRFIVDVT